MHILNKKELKSIIDHLQNEAKIDDATLFQKLNDALYWQEALHAINLIFVQVLQNKIKTGVDSSKIIDMYYTIGDRYRFIISDCDYKFIGFLVSHQSIVSLSLEDDLINRYHKYVEHDYHDALRP